MICIKNAWTKMLYFLLGVFIVILVLSLIDNAYAIPSEVKKILEGQMGKIFVSLPQDCDPDSVAKQKAIEEKSWRNCWANGYVRDGKCIMPPLHPTVSITFRDSKFLQYLANKGYVKVETLDVSNLYTTKTIYTFFYYTDKISLTLLGLTNLG